MYICLRPIFYLLLNVFLIYVPYSFNLKESQKFMLNLHHERKSYFYDWLIVWFSSTVQLHVLWYAKFNFCHSSFTGAKIRNKFSESVFLF